MGPIRAFIRPSHAAAHEHSATTASLFCPTQPFSAQHPSCCSHVTPSLAPHHLNSSRHPFYAAAAANPLHAAGLVSSASQPCFYNQFRKFLPPTAPLVSPLPVLTALSKSPGENARADINKEGRGTDRWGVTQNDYEWGEGADEGRGLSGKNVFGRNKIDLKGHKESGLNKWKASTSLRSEWSKWNEDRKRKDKEEVCKGKRGNKEEAKSSKKEKTSHVSCLSSSLPKHEEEPLPSSSSRVALVFPFSDDEEEEDEEDFNEEGLVPEDRGRVTWRISDIVETEDEEGDTQQFESKGEGIQEVEESCSDTAADIQKRAEKNQSLNDVRSVTEPRVETSEDGEKEIGKDNRKTLTDLIDSSPNVNSLVSIVSGSRNPNQIVPGRFTNVVSVESTEYQNGCSSDVVKSEEGLKNSHLKVIEKSKVNKDVQCDNRVNKDDHQKIVKECKKERKACKLEKEKKGIEDEQEEEEEEEGEEGEGDEEGEEEPSQNGVRVTQRLRPRSYRQFLLTRERRSRVFLKERSYHLGRWFVTHFTHPYPSKEQKDILAAKASMTRHQVSEWFGNMRRRIREATRGLGICWEERVRIYNSVITGKSEPLPILPEDDINNWVPPKSHEPLVTDTHEEVSASPKFKTTLLHRYLNNPEAPDLSIDDGSVAATSIIVATVTGATNTAITNTSCFASVIESPKTCFPRVLPLCTSSPKESIKELWNSSFEHIKDNYLPSVNSRNMPREQRGKSVNAHSADDTRKIVRKYEGPVNPDSKRPRLAIGPVGDWFQGPSTSRQLSEYISEGQGENENGRAFRGTQVIETSKFPLSSWGFRRTAVDYTKSSEDDLIEERHLRKPEELAAAYTLVELQHM